MPGFETTLHDSIALVTLTHGKVNAIDRDLVAELSTEFIRLADDDTITAVILTGRGKFFSFGLDVPALYDLSPIDFTTFVRSFCDLYTRLFLFPKPLIGLLNGHTVAGGCILALACDYRIMTDGKAVIGLNEVTFGSTLFAGSIEMLRHVVGGAEAENVVLAGDLYDPDEALEIGLVDDVVEPSELTERALDLADKLSQNGLPAYQSLKQMVRRPIYEAWRNREADQIKEFVDIWYLPETRQMTGEIEIR